MFAGIKNLLGNVTVVVKNGIVKVEGVPTHVIKGDIKRVWGTGKIEANLFLEIEDYSFSFYEFFALEVHYAISRMIEERKVRANRRTLAKIRDALTTETWLANLDKAFTPKIDRTKLVQMAYPPLEFQDKFLDAYDQVTQQWGLNGQPLAGAAGSGKTYTGLTLSTLLGKDLTIIVCPNNALNRVWEDQILKSFKHPPSYWLSNSGQPYRGQKYIIVNYEFLKNLLAMLPKLTYKDLMIILDESHNLNEISSMRTELFLELCERTKCKDVVWLSGTPIKALSVETIPLFRCIDPLFTPEVEKAFKKIFGVSTERATDILNNRLNGIMYKIEKKELGLLAPHFLEIKVVVPNSTRFTLAAIRIAMQKFTEERSQYYAHRKKQDEKTFYDAMDYFARKMPAGKKTDLTYYYRCLDTVIRCGGDARFCKEEMIFCNRFESREILPVLPKEMREGFREAKTIVKYVKLKIQGECLGRVVGRARIDAHIAMADYLDYVAVVESTEKKTVVFTSFTEVIEKLREFLPTQNLQPLFVYAATNKNLSQILDQFEKDEDINPLVATYASLSTAVPLIMADTMIMLDAPWRDYQLQQTVSRISRIGATTQTTVYTAVLDTGDKPNISTRSFDILKWSQQQVEQIVGIKSPFEITDNLEQADMALESLTEAPIYEDPFAEALARFEAAFEEYGLEESPSMQPRSMSW